MGNGKYTFHRRALMAFQQLEPGEQAQVRESLEALLALPVAEWPTTQARKLPVDEPEYLVRVNDNFCAIVQAAEGPPPEVLDIFTQERLKFFADAAPGAGNGGSANEEPIPDGDLETLAREEGALPLDAFIADLENP